MIRVQVVADYPAAARLGTALCFEPGIGSVEPHEEGVGAMTAGAPMPSRPHVLVLAEPLGLDLVRNIAAFREVAPGIKIVLLAITSRAGVLSGRGLADAVIDAAGGVMPLLAAVRAVVGVPCRAVTT